MSDNRRPAAVRSHSSARAAFAGAALALVACHPPPTPTGSGQEVLSRLRAALGSTAADVDVLGDGTVHLQQTFTAGQRTGFVLLRSGVPLTSEQRGNGTLTLTVYAGGRPARITELAPIGSGLLSVRVTRFAVSAADPDTRDTWTEDHGSPTVDVVREVSPDHDGRFTESATFTKARGDDDLSVPASGSNCSSLQRQELQQAFDQTVAAAIDCLQGLDPDLALRLGAAVAAHSYSVLCGGPDATRYGHFDQDPAGQGGGTVTLFDAAFGSAASLEEALLHEVLHDKLLLGDHERQTNPNLDPSDRVYGCARTCFNPQTASSITCAACAKLRNGDGKCSHFTPVGCSGIYFCSCNDGFYYNLDKCTAACSGALSCAFGSVCGPATAASTNGLCP